ncbi:MAG: hypothetical protein IH865_02860 [Chloroflexi bacterium]|nr:hypothetical protein [Chloroflexota bacterium]
MMRAQLSIPEERKEELELLRKATGSPNIASLLNASLTAFQWLVLEAASGRRIVSVIDGEDIERELVMRELQKASASRIMAQRGAVSATAVAVSEG